MARLQKIVLRDFTGGLSPSNYFASENQYQSGSGIDPLQEPGVLQAGFAQNDETNAETTTTASKFVAPGVSGDEEFVYGYSPTRMYRFDSFNLAITDNSSWVQTIDDGDEGGFEAYKGKVYYANGGDKVGSFTPGATPTFDPETLTGFTESTYRPMHPFLGTLWIGNLNDVYSWDGSTSTASALDIPTGYEIDHISDYRGYLVVSASHFSGDPTENITSDTKVFFWDTVSESPLEEVNVPGETRIRGMRQWRGGLYIIGSNALYQYNGSSFVPIVSFSVGGYTGNSNINISPDAQVNALDTWKNFLVWPGTNHVCFYGSSDPRIAPSIFTPLRLSVGHPVNVFGGKDSLILVSGTGAVRLATFETGAQTGVTFDTRNIWFDQKVKIKGVRMFFKGLASGDSAAISYRFRAGTGESSVSLGSISESSDGSISEKYLIPANEPITNHMYLRISFDGGAINFLPNIEIFYESQETEEVIRLPSPQV